MGRRRNWLQLQCRTSRHAGRYRARACGHFPAALGAAQCRHTSFRRRSKYLFMFAGVYGQLRTKVCGCWGPIGWRLLRIHTRTHPRNEGRIASKRGTLQSGRSQRIRCGGRAVSSPRSVIGKTFQTRCEACRRRISDYGGDCSSQGNRHPERTRRRTLPQIRRRRWHQYSR